MFDFLNSKKKYTYSKQDVSLGDVWEVVKVFRSGWLTQGPKIREFEKALCDYTGAKYCVLVANGTLGLQIAVQALGLKPGFEGITTPITFLASANCILQNGGVVQFADIEPDTANMDVAELEKKITDKTKVIIPVAFAGQPCDMEKIYALAQKHGAYVIEDAAHAIGSDYKGQKVGSGKYADITLFSFHPVKTITSGEGGALLTNNKEIYEKLQMMRTIGVTKDPKKMTRNDGPWYYEMQYLSANERITDFQAALGASQLKRLESFKAKRRMLVQAYRDAFANDPRFSLLKERSYSNGCFHLCPFLINFEKVSKDKVQIFNELKRENLFLQVHYIPVHTQPYYQNLGFKKGDFPKAEKYYEKTLSLPLYNKLSKSDVIRIAGIIKKVCI